MNKCDYCGEIRFSSFAVDWSNPKLPPAFTKPKRICLQCLPSWPGQTAVKDDNEQTWSQAKIRHT